MSRPSWNANELEHIFLKTNGACHICHGQEGPIAWQNYGRRDTEDGWEVDHVKAAARGGSDKIRNMRAAHWQCNASRQDTHFLAARAQYGVRRGPRSADEVAHRAKKRFLLGATVTPFALAAAGYVSDSYELGLAALLCGVGAYLLGQRPVRADGSPREGRRKAQGG